MYFGFKVIITLKPKTMNAIDQKRSENSSLYFQIGLVLSLILTYLFIEIEIQSVSTDSLAPNRIVDISEVYTQKFTIEKPVVLEPVVQSKPKFVNSFKPVAQTNPEDNEPVEMLTPISEPTTDNPTDDPIETAPVTIITPKPDFFERGAVEESPTFMACANLKGVQRDICFNEQLKKFLMSNLKYPGKALDNGIEGSIAVQFIIDKNGNITSVKSLNSNNKDLENEALRVVSKLPKMKPGRQGNENVSVRYTVPISFKIPK
jgi:periplasmic protein TonB